MRLTIDVIVPTFRRPDMLAACLQGLVQQLQPPDRVLVVVRPDDLGSHAVVAACTDLAGLEMVLVFEPGVVAAMSAGVARSSGAIIAFTDDDAVPRPAWVGQLVERFEDEGIGAVGGRDVIAAIEAPLCAEVGVLVGTTRLVGNHHLGTGPPRDVDVLKGVNMAFRAEVLGLPAPGTLLGSGAQAHHEVLSCRYTTGLGRRIVYDPEIVVDHFAGPRIGLDQRNRPHLRGVFESAHNFTLAVSSTSRAGALRHAAGGLAIGTSDRPGVARAAVAVVRRETDVLRRVGPASLGLAVATLRVMVHPRRRRVVLAGELRDGEQARGNAQDRLHVTLVAHAVHDRGGMERACAELIRRTSDRVAFTVASIELAPELVPFVDRWLPVRVPQRPAPLRFFAFYVVAGLVVRRRSRGLVQAVGAIIPNHVDVAAVHYCHAGGVEATGIMGARQASPSRRLNTGLVRALALAAERWTYRPSRARSLTAVSSDSARELLEHFPDMTVTVVPNGVDHKRFHPSSEVRADVRRERLVPETDLVALFVGGDWERKGLEVVLEALAELDPGIPLQLWVVGAGDERRFAARARLLGVRDRVWFAGSQRSPERFFQASDMFVLPSSYETFSMAAYEAAACALPVILTPVHGARELVRAERAGIEVAPVASQVATALRRLAGDAMLRQQMGSSAHEMASTYTWERSSEAMADVYRQLRVVDSHGVQAW